jgi:hypothetical protein
MSVDWRRGKRLDPHREAVTDPAIDGHDLRVDKALVRDHPDVNENLFDGGGDVVALELRQR